MTSMERWTMFVIMLLLPGQSVKSQERSSRDLVKRGFITQQFARQAVRDRADFIKRLTEIVGDERADRTERVRAVRLLGALRAIRAVAVLLRHLDEITPETIDEKTVSTILPCVPALIKIGKPASRTVLKEFHKPMKGPRRLALAVVLDGVEERQVGRFMLQREVAQARTPEERRNLQAGLKAFLAMTANERNADELKAEERAKHRKNRSPAKRRQ